jgi:hypothetical protein
MAKKRRRIPLNDDNHSELGIQLERVKDTLVLVRDILYQEISSETPSPLRNIPGPISFALKEIEAIEKAWTSLFVPCAREDVQEPVVPTKPATAPTLRLVAKDASLTNAE